MTKLQLRYKREHDDAKPPTKAHATDAGWDLCTVERCWLEPGRTYKLGTGLVLAAPDGHYLDIRARSSLTLKGIAVAGVIDEGYRAELYLLVSNRSLYPYEVKAGARIAQALVLPVPECEAVEVESFESTARGEGGFGSTDRKAGNGG